MSTQPILSPLEQLAQTPEPQAAPASSSGLSPLEQLAQSQPPSGSQSVQDTGEVTNDVGNKVIVPKPGESFADTMARARAYGATVTQDQIDKEMATAPKKVATVVAAAPAIGFGGEAALAAPGALYDLAVKHLAGSVLPGMEEEAAKAKLLELAPKVIKVARDLSVGSAGLHYLWKAVLGSK